MEQGGTVGIEDYLERIDGMTFGPDPREGVFTDNRFDHAGLGFRFEFPPGWKTVNARDESIVTGFAYARPTPSVNAMMPEYMGWRTYR